MNLSTAQIQILYEIALCIGEGANLKQAVNKALTVYLQKLDCFGAAIYKSEIIKNSAWYQRIGSVPTNIDQHKAFLQATDHLPQSLQDSGKPLPSKEFPIIKHFDDNSYANTLELPGFGLLVMIKKGEPFPSDLLNALHPLNKKLADALKSFNDKEKLHLHSAALEASSNAISITDNNKHLIWVNQAWCDFNGYTREEAIGQNSNILKSGLHEPVIFENMWQTLLNGKTWNGTVVNKRKDSSTYIAEINITPVLDDARNITHFIGISQDVTKRTLAEEQLQKNETLLSTLVQTIPDMVWLKDADGVYLACNPPFENFFGAKESEIVNKTDYDFVNTELGDFFREHDKLAMESDSPTVNEEEVTFASDGHKALLETIKSPMKDLHGNIIGVMGIARDITERKLAETNLKESKLRFQELANLLPQPIWETNIDGIFTYANKAGFEILGYKPDDIIDGLAFMEVIAPQDRERISKNFSKKLRGVANNDFEYSCLRKNGETFPVLIYTSPIRHNDTIIGIRGITLDISNLKKAEEDLKYFSSLQEVLIHISTKYINVSIDEIHGALQDALQEIGKFVSADRAYIFDYDFKKEITCNTYEWCGDGIEPQIENLKELPLEVIPQWVEKHIKAQTVYIPDVLALAVDDDLREVLEPQDIKSLIAVPMMHGDECFGFIGFDSVRSHHTYSDKERAILEVFAQMVVNFQLRSKVEHELKQAKEKAETAEKAQFSFLSTMSHEIRTPLNAVVGLTNILLMEEPLPTQLQNLNTLKFSSQNLLSIINDILDYNKLASGKVVLEQADFSIHDILRGMQYAMNSIAKTKGIDLGYTIAKEIPEVIVGDSTRLLQIINNLVSNAIKFTKKGGVHVDVKQTKITSKRIRLHVKVKDSGIGIPENKFADVFEEFKQTSNSTTREYGGTGLGLSIVKKLLQSMDSDIHLESEVGKGSIFSFEIEFLVGDKKKNICDETKMVVIDDSLKGIRILLVEDNKINQMVASKFLSEWKCKVDIADNGQIAIDKLLQNKYDAVLMDLQMPVMDGYTASTEIRKMQDEHIRNIPIIALSASALGEIETRARKYGMNDFVTKPFVPEVLYKTLVKHTL